MDSTLKERTQQELLIASEAESPMVTPQDISLMQAQAATSIANSLAVISSFIASGGLATMLTGIAKTQAANGVIQGLVTHSGRNGLDARFATQNMKDAFHSIEALYDGFAERLAEKKRGQAFEEVDAEAGYKHWAEQEDKRGSGE